MPRTAQADDAVRTDILKAAARVFQRWGFAKTTMEDIAREAGKGKSTIYYYFHSKDEIIDTMVIAEVSQLLTRAKAAVMQVDSAKEKIRTYIVASLSEMQNVATVYRVVLTEIRENPRFLATIRKEFEAQEVAYLREILTLGVRQGEFTLKGRREIDSATRVLSGIIRSLELFLFLEDYNSEDVDMAARLVAYGI
jgi:AcrR family transcriptional regulator